MNKYFIRSQFLWIFLLFSDLSGSDSNFALDEKVQSICKAIVRIEVVSEKGSGGRMMKSQSTGSGVIISKDGLIVTNHHVAGKASRLTCRLYDGEELMADLIGADPLTDLALLRLRLKNRSPLKQALKIGKFGNSDQVKVGDLCFAMGSPAGLSQSVTRGIISNVALISASQQAFRLDGENVGELVRWLGHDAVIYPGNSGGPLVDDKGKIIGINEVGIGSLGGAIPSNLAKEVIEELNANGYVSRSWIGLECQPLIDYNQSGVLVAGVISGSPSEKSGLKAGDLITHYDGKKVSALILEDIPIFNQLVYSRTAGKKIEILGKRNGNDKKWTVIPMNREPAFAKEKELKSWGLTIRDFTLMSSLESLRKDKNGVQVHSVNRGGPASSAKPNLVPGDVIKTVGGQRINSTNELISVSRKIMRGKKEAVATLIGFERNLAELVTVIKIGPEAEENQPVQAWKPWLGVSTQVITREIAKALNLPPSTRGIRIAQVFPKTPAERAGLKNGDLLYRIDGQIIQAHRIEDAEVFGNMIKQYKTDAIITLNGISKGNPFELKVALEKRPDPSNELPKYEEETFEFTLRELSFADRVNRRLSLDQSGLVVDNVEPAGWAALAGLRQGDLLLQVDGKPIREVDKFKHLMNQLINQKQKRIVFFVRRGIHTLFLELEPDWKKEV